MGININYSMIVVFKIIILITSAQIKVNNNINIENNDINNRYVSMLKNK